MGVERPVRSGQGHPLVKHLQETHDRVKRVETSIAKMKAAHRSPTVPIYDPEFPLDAVNAQIAVQAGELFFYWDGDWHPLSGGIRFNTDPQTDAADQWLLVHTTGGHTPSGGLTLAGLTPTLAGMVFATTGGDLWIGTTDTSLLKLAAGGGITLDGGDGINGAATFVEWLSGPDGFLGLNGDGVSLTQQGGGGRPTKVMVAAFGDDDSNVMLNALPSGISLPDNGFPTGPAPGPRVHLVAGTADYGKSGTYVFLDVGGVFEVRDSQNNPVLRVTDNFPAVASFEMLTGATWLASL